MSLNITYLLNTLQGFYDSSKGTGKKYTGSESGIGEMISAYGLSGVIDVELNNDNLIKSIIEGGVKVTVSSLTNTRFSYKIDEATNKIIIFGNNLTISVDEENEDLIEVVGISNEINATKANDKITLFGYDNKVNADEGKDTVTVYGEDNILKDSEVNIFNGVGGQYLVFDDKEFLAYLNDSDSEESTTITYEKTQDGIKFSGDNMRLIAQSDTDDKIECSDTFLTHNIIGDEGSVDRSGDCIDLCCVTCTEYCKDTECCEHIAEPFPVLTKTVSDVVHRSADICSCVIDLSEMTCECYFRELGAHSQNS